MRIALLVVALALTACAGTPSNNTPSNAAPLQAKSFEKDARRSDFSDMHLAASDEAALALRNMSYAKSLKVQEDIAFEPGVSRRRLQMAMEAAFSTQFAMGSLSPRLAKALSPDGCRAAAAMFRLMGSIPTIPEILAANPHLKNMRGTDEVVAQQDAIMDAVRRYVIAVTRRARFEYQRNLMEVVIGPEGVLPAAMIEAQLDQMDRKCSGVGCKPEALFPEGKFPPQQEECKPPELIEPLSQSAMTSLYREEPGDVMLVVWVDKLGRARGEYVVASTNKRLVGASYRIAGNAEFTPPQCPSGEFDFAVTLPLRFQRIED